MIEARELTKRYGPFLALDGVSFSVSRGDVTGFLGLNGAGKTTTLRIVACFLPPTRGSVRVAGFDTVRDSDEVRRRIGYLPERVPLYDDMQVREYLRFRSRLKGLRGGDADAATDRVIARCGLEAKRRNQIGHLSKGQRQRVGLADALVHEPDLLILDEPTSGLDPDQRLEVRKLIAEIKGERTVFLSTHILPEAEAVCDHVIIIHHGRIRASDRLDRLRGERSKVRVVHGGPPLPAYGEAEPALAADAGNGTTSVVVADRDAGSRVVRQAVGAGREVLEMAALTPDLEAIFLAITGGKDAPR